MKRGRKNIGPDGDAIFEARLVRKYGSLRWLNTYNELGLRFYHPNRMNLNKKRGNNKYNIFSTMEGYERNIPHVTQSDLYYVWVTNIDFLKK